MLITGGRNMKKKYGYINTRVNCLLPETSTIRVKKTREEAAKQGRKRKEYLVSDDEHIKIKALLSELRG